MLHPRYMSTYTILAPPATHTRPATCAEAGCGAYTRGWVSIIDVSTALGRSQADYITTTSGRHFTVTRQPGGIVEYRFPPGQECFQSAGHRVPLEREPVFLVRRGARTYDHTRGVWVGGYDGQRRHDAPEHWVEDFAENQDRLTRRIGG